MDVHVQTRGALVDFCVERFDGHSRVVVRSIGGRREEFWVALHAHDGRDAAFAMTCRKDGRVRFRWGGRQRVFGFDARQHAVVEVGEGEGGGATG